MSGQSAPVPALITTTVGWPDHDNAVIAARPPKLQPALTDRKKSQDFVFFDKKLKELSDKNHWKMKEFFKSNYIASKDVNAWLGIAEVTK